MDAVVRRWLSTAILVLSGLPDRKVRGHPFAVLGSHGNNHLRIRIRAQADLKATHTLFDPLDQHVPTTAYRYQHRCRHAPLAGRAQASTYRSFSRFSEISVGKHHHMVLRSTKGLDPLAFVGGSLIQVAGHRGLEPTKLTAAIPGEPESCRLPHCRH